MMSMCPLFDLKIDRNSNLKLYEQQNFQVSIVVWFISHYLLNFLTYGDSAGHFLNTIKIIKWQTILLKSFPLTIFIDSFYFNNN